MHDHSETSAFPGEPARRFAVVTGANKGIGKHIAGQLADEGVTVFAGSRDPERGRRAVTELAGLSVRRPSGCCPSPAYKTWTYRDNGPEHRRSQCPPRLGCVLALLLTRRYAWTLILTLTSDTRWSG